ncbi:MAG: hypothetical protein KTR22_10320 [Flavobacteriaceae bacterium]|nr:hypothetical protein [Flavobacteriaceae bacterium]
MKRFKIIPLALFAWVLLSAQANAQTYQEILEKTLEKTEAMGVYEVSTEYKMMRGLDNPKVYEHYTGKLVQNGSKIYQQLGAMEFVQSDSFYVKLNHDDKEILIGTLKDTNSPQLSDFDLEAILEHFENGKLIKNGKYFKIELKGKADNPLQMAKLDLYVDKESYLLRKQSMIFSRVTDFSIYEEGPATQDLDAARLEISYSDYNSNVDSNLFAQERYFQHLGDDIVLGEEFSDFELIPLN